MTLNQTLFKLEELGVTKQNFEQKKKLSFEESGWDEQHPNYTDFGEPWLRFNVKQNKPNLLMSGPVSNVIYQCFTVSHSFSTCFPYFQVHRSFIILSVCACAWLRTIKRISTFLKRNSCGSRSRVRLVFLESRPSAPWKCGVGHNTCFLRTDTHLSKHRVSHRARLSWLPKWQDGQKAP